MRLLLLSSFLAGCAHAPLATCAHEERVVKRAQAIAVGAGLSGLSASLGLIPPQVKLYPPDDAAISITAFAGSAIVMSTIATGIYQTHRNRLIKGVCTK